MLTFILPRSQCDNEGPAFTICYLLAHSSPCDAAIHSVVQGIDASITPLQSSVYLRSNTLQQPPLTFTMNANH